MFELRGKYNSCKVFTDNVDNETIGQVTNILNQPWLSGSQIRIMSDCHAGSGCVIGTTIKMNSKYVVPNLVGHDVGCGVLAIKIRQQKVDLDEIDNIIRTYVPFGAKSRSELVARSNIGDVKCKINKSRALSDLGTLGGGNHFIEIDKGSDGSLWLVIHSGSRHVGMEICEYYQNLAYEKLKQQGKNINRDLAYLEGSDFDDYIHDMKLAQEHASINRATIAEQIIRRARLYETEIFETVHNYIDCDNMILRKGAVSAQAGEKLIVPMNMRDGSLICLGKGNPDWNYSAPHGAGRLMRRSQAKESISLEEYRASMNGIYTTCVNRSTIDESPMAYKPMGEIKENIQDTLEIVEVIQPIYNFKASES